MRRLRIERASRVAVPRFDSLFLSFSLKASELLLHVGLVDGILEGGRSPPISFEQVGKARPPRSLGPLDSFYHPKRRERECPERDMIGRATAPGVSFDSAGDAGTVPRPHGPS